jgi:hypothetical protein
MYSYTFHILVYSETSIQNSRWGPQKNDVYGKTIDAETCVK